MNTIVLLDLWLPWLVLSTIVTTLPCCVFLFINVTTLYTLRSKAVFRETSRYILLFNLLFADTIQLVYSQTMFLLSACEITLLYPVCAALIVLYSLPDRISPVTLVIMCLERYVAVCYPFRHSTIITMRNTRVVICVVWTFSSLNVIIQLILLYKFSFPDMQNVQITGSCGNDSVFVDLVSDLYDKVSTYFLFALGGVTVLFSYIGIIVAARSVSTNKASANKARKTLLLHLVQMGLSMSSTIHNSLLIVISQNLGGIVIMHVLVFLYIFLTILPKCLSCLIYGLRDQTIRPVLMFNLSCQWRHSSLISDVPARSKTPAT
ncbi:olfactory receptor 1073-like [Austrofundulus limnaeus]|uniref:Olfactory receptor 1073-like n=1 Tax=Austrofundulus limnaeus TaxID=52670 RepID=A0A2I4CU71_AUSLI|nr:PREDICTED: olfactory receptor 1073-like [Austrofundulus limnaeus]